MNVQKLLVHLAVKAGSQQALAQELGVPPSFLSRVITGREEPGPTMLAALNLERVITYRRKRA